MDDLSAGARELIEQARPGEDPSDGDRVRVRRALAARLAAGVVGVAATGAGAGAASAAGASAAGVATGAGVGTGAGVATGAGGAAGAASAAAGAGLLWKIGAVVGIVASVGAGAVLVTAYREPAPSMASASASSPRAAPAASTRQNPAANVAGERPAGGAAAPSAAADAVDRPEGAPSRASAMSEVSSARSATTGAGSSTASAAQTSSASSFDDEMALMLDAQRALREGRSARALELLAEHDRRFGKGALDEERAAAQVFALCQAGRAPEARAEALRFLAAYPSSPLAERVRAACAP